MRFQKNYGQLKNKFYYFILVYRIRFFCSFFLTIIIQVEMSLGLANLNKHV